MYIQCAFEVLSLKTEIVSELPKKFERLVQVIPMQIDHVCTLDVEKATHKCCTEELF